MSTNIEQVKRTVRDLLNLAENDAATEGEIANALRFARRMMDAHHLSEDECRNDPHAEAGRKENMTRESAFGDTYRLAGWEGSLAMFVAEFIGSVGAYSAGRQQVRKNGIAKFNRDGSIREQDAVVFFGPDEDVALAMELFDTLRTTAATMARLRYGAALKGPGRSYAEGFVAGLFEKLNDAKRIDDQSSAQSHALIVRSTEIALAKHNRAVAWLRETHGVRIRKRSGRAGGDHHEDAYGSGKADGMRANVSANRKAKLGNAQRHIS